MRAFKSNVDGLDDSEGDHIGVELESTVEIRRLRHKGDIPHRAFVLVFTRDGAVKRFPGYGQFALNADEAAYFESIRQFALAAKL